LPTVASGRSPGRLDMRSRVFTQPGPGTDMAGPSLPIINFLDVTNIDQQPWNPEEHAGSITAPLQRLPVTESFALPPDLKVECNDRLPSRNPATRNPATPLPEMPNAHEACAHIAGAYRIRTSHVRLRQMRSRRTNRYSVRSNEVWRCWLARWRITATNIGHVSARRYGKAQIENT
jgi:hypothetical protein